MITDMSATTEGQSTHMRHCKVCCGLLDKTVLAKEACLYHQSFLMLSTMKVSMSQRRHMHPFNNCHPIGTGFMSMEKSKS